MDAELEPGDAQATAVHHSVVLGGSFNPAILQPRWFAAVGVLPAAEADAITDTIVSPGLTTFRTPRLSLQATSDRIVFRSVKDLSPGELAERVVSVFKELPHSPITSIDLVHEFDLPPDALRWDAVAQGLVQTQMIRGVLPGAEVAVLELECEGHDGSVVELILESSEDTPEGVYIRVDREYALEPVDSASAQLALDLLSSHWEKAFSEASTIVHRMTRYFA